MAKLFKRLLAIDPGSSCGYAYIDIVYPTKIKPKIDGTKSGKWDLGQKSFEGGGVRLVKFRHHLKEMDPDMIVYEDTGAMRFKSSDAARIRNEFLGVLKCYCESSDPPIPFTAFHVSKIKIRATGKGNSGKDEMTKAANREFGTKLQEKNSEKVGDDDIADALWLLDLALDKYWRGLDG